MKPFLTGLLIVIVTLFATVAMLVLDSEYQIEYANLNDRPVQE